MPDPSPHPLTPTALAAHLGCRHLTQLRRAVAERRLVVEFRTDPGLKALMLRGAQHEAQFVESLRAAGRRIRDLAQAHHRDATLAAMREGFDAIVQAPLADATTRGRADVLLRVAPPPGHTFAYEPYDTKLTRETKAGTLLQLVCYAEMLEALQGHRPARVHVVTPVETESYATSEYAAYTRLVRRSLLAANAGPPPVLGCPDPVPHCEICNYRAYCTGQRRTADHPGFVAGLGALHLSELQRQRITTLRGFAERDGQLPEPPRRGHVATYAKLGRQARLQLASRGQAKPLLERLAVEAGRGFCRLPAPSPGDVFLDFEGDPFVAEGGREYLTGWTCGAAGQVDYEARWAFTRGDERTAVEDLLDFVAARLREDPGLHVYHFGAYEPAAIKRLVQRYGTRADVLDVLLRGERFVDLHTVVREALRVGVERYGLKQLEVLSGFVREQDLEAAGSARRHVEFGLELGDHDSITDDVKRQVAAYNREDCIAAQALRDWLEAQRQEAIAAGAVIDRPAGADGAPSAKTTERERQIEVVAAALRTGLPGDPAAHDPEQRARALLADLLGYFQREEKSSWWEHFRLRDLETAELLEEREALTGLVHVRTLAQQGRQTVPRDEYSFPQQETAIEKRGVYVGKDDDPVVGGIGTKLGEVLSIDPVARRIVIKKTRAAAALHPRSIFRDQVVNAGELEEALLAFGVELRDHGFDGGGAYAAASELLRRRVPRRRSGTGEALPRDGEDVVAAAIRLCLDLDGGVLPIQGPPGSGKTLTGARAIVALVRAGRRVGVTAVSHKVIDNLLRKVRAEAQCEGVPVRLVHKHDEEAPDGIEYTGDNDEALGAIGAGTVVGGTAWLWARDDALGKLDHLFVDEAGQMSLAQTLAAARAARNLVLLGDPQQLEQPKQGAHPDGAEIAALVHLLGDERATVAPGQGLFLDQTWRLHPRLCQFTSELYYESRLRSAPGLELQALRGPSPFAGAGLFLVESPHEGNQSAAPEEADVVLRIARSLLDPGVQWTDRDGVTTPLAAEQILVVAPYNAQVAALRACLAPLGITRVGTVDRFQGQEAAVVVYSCTSSSAEDAPRGMGFLYDPHRFNVATSRARSTVIVVASPRLFEPDCRTPEQVRMANGLCRYREMATLVPFD